MTPPNDAESALYADLTALLQRMRGATYAEVKFALEERFQAFLRAHRAGASALSPNHPDDNGARRRRAVGCLSHRIPGHGGNPAPPRPRRRR